METKLAEALNKFIKQYPHSTSADLQTFVLGWRAAVKYMTENKIEIKFE